MGIPAERVIYIAFLISLLCSPLPTVRVRLYSLVTITLFPFSTLTVLFLIASSGDARYQSILYWSLDPPFTSC